MKKIGILLTVLIIIVLIAVGSIAYAFYSASQATFTLIVHSAEGESIGLELTIADTALTPAKSSAGADNYSPASGANGESYASYTIGYVATSGVQVKLYLDDISFTYLDQANITEQEKDARDEVLSEMLQFCISMTAQTYDWTKTYLEDDTLAIQSISAGSGSIYCYIRFNKTQDEVPLFYNGTKISFRIVSEVQ